MTTNRRRILSGVAAAASAGVAAWLSQGTIGFAADDGPRLAVVPLSPASVGIAALASLAVVGLWRAGASLLPLTLLGFLLLSWMPFPVPAAFLLWQGPASAVLWIAVFLMMGASIPGQLRLSVSSPRTVVAAAALVLFSLSAWRAAPMIPGGDEPHYLVITQSLLTDRSLAIDGVHRRGDYHAYFAGELRPDIQRRGRNGEIYSIHAPGLPVLVAPAFVVGGYHGVVAFLVVLAAAGSALAWHLAWLATRREDAAWFACAAVTLPVTAIFQSFTIYPDGPGGILALTGLWALLRANDEANSGATATKPWLWHGIALALLPWLHSRFAVLAGGFGALILLRLSTTKNPAAKAVAFLAVPAVSAILWVGFFVALYGSPDPSSPYAPGGGSFAFVPGGLTGLLFDQRFGLLTYAPVVAIALGGLAVMIVRAPWRRLSFELLFVLLPYLLTVTHFAMWWGGWSAPARFFAPVLPLLVVPAAVAWQSMQGRVSRFVAAAALCFTAIASTMLVVVDRGRLAYNTREAPALWLEWVGRVVDLTRAAPLWSRDTDTPLFRAVAVWVILLTAAWLAMRFLDRTGGACRRAVIQTMTAAALVAAVMLASTMVWAFEGSDGRSVVASQLQLLETVGAHDRAMALQVNGWSPLALAHIAQRLKIQLERRVSRGPGGQPLFALPPLPAGDYRVRVPPDGSRGWVMLGIARDPRDPFALRTIQLPSAPIDLRFAMPVRSLVVRGDEEAARSVRGLVLEPVRVFAPSEQLTRAMARRAVRYGATTVFFVDDRSFPEPEAFWVGGSRDSTVVIQPDAARSSVRIRLRNAPVDNQVTLHAGGWQQELRMAAGEEQQLEVPMDTARGGAVLRITATSGFRPSEEDPRSRDQRFLGVWVKIE